MKFLLPILFLITILFFNYSIQEEQDADEDQTTIEVPKTTTAWWTRTFPIIPPRTVAPRPRPPVRTTTGPNRVSSTVSIVVPLVLFCLTLFIGFGLIAYAIKTGGNGMFFLTRTNERLIP